MEVAITGTSGDDPACINRVSDFDHVVDHRGAQNRGDLGPRSGRRWPADQIGSCGAKGVVNAARDSTVHEVLGILKPFAPDERMKKILAESARVGDATARAIFYGSRTPDGFFMRTVREYASSRRAPLSSNLYPPTKPRRQCGRSQR